MEHDVVEFQDCAMEDHFISYKLQRDFTPGNADWIGLFPNEFSSLDDYIVYEYIGRGEFTILLHSRSRFLMSLLLFFFC